MLKDIRKNPILLTDSYNLSHQHLKIDTSWEVSHMYNRAKPMILFGLLENLGDLLNTKITMDMVDEAEEIGIRLGIKFPRDIWEKVVKECNGFLPIQIQSLKEGTWCPIGTPICTSEKHC